MATYYIDPVDGDDANSGLTEALAKETYGSITQSEGDILLGKRGTTAREKITFTENNVTISDYGNSSERHIISGSQIIANGSWSKTGGRTNVYQFTYAIPTAIDSEGMVWEDGTRLTRVAAVSTCDSTAGSFYHTGGVMYVHASDSSDVTANGKVYELPNVAEVIDFVAVENCTLEKVETIRCWSDDGSGYGPILLSGTNNTIDNIKSHDNRRHCVQFLDDASYPCNYNVLKNSELYDCTSSSVVSVFSVTSGQGVLGNTVENNNIYQQLVGALGNLLVCHGNSGGPQSTVIKNNLLHDQDENTNNDCIRIYDTVNTHFHGNYVYNIDNCYIESDNTNTGFRFEGNKVDFTDSVGSRPAFYVESANARISHNVFKGSQESGQGVYCLYFQGAATGCKVYNNVFDHRYGIRVVADSQTNFEADYNKYYCSNASPMRWGTGMNFSTWQSTSGQDANSTLEAETETILDSDLNVDQHRQGTRFWSPGINPVGYDGEPISDLNPSIGSIQYTDPTSDPFHPKNL